MLIFFPLLRRLSLTEALVPSPMVTMLSVKEAFLFPVFSVVQSDIEEHLRIRLLRGPRDPNIWGLHCFPLGRVGVGGGDVSLVSYLEQLLQHTANLLL